MNIDSGDNFEFQFPAGCEACPVQCSIIGELRDVQFAKAEAEDFAHLLVGKSGQEFDDLLQEISEGDQDFVETFGQIARQKTADTLDMVDDAAESLVEKSKLYANSCDKPLKMRATKEGKVYEVHLCTSALAHYVNDDVSQHADTHVWVRTPKSDS